MEPSADDVAPVSGRTIFDALQEEVTQLHGYWKLYRQLFTTEERVAMLDRAASSAFGIFQETLARSIELSIARLLDPTANRKQDNLTLRRLPDLLAERGFTELAAEASERLATLTEQCRLVVARRHKKVSHADLHVSLGTVVLDPLTWPVIDKAVAAIGRLMKRVEAALCGESVATVYEMIVLHGDGHDLIDALERAQAYWDDRRAKRGLPPLRP